MKNDECIEDGCSRSKLTMGKTLFAMCSMHYYSSIKPKRLDLKCVEKGCSRRRVLIDKTLMDMCGVHYYLHKGAEIPRAGVNKKADKVGRWILEVPYVRIHRGGKTDGGR